MVIRIGCCGFPVKRDTYAVRFQLVEVQRTFYQPPRLSTAQKWRRQRDPDFEFTLKAWQLITHEAKSPTYRRLRRDLSEEEKSQAGSFQPTPLVQEAWETTRVMAQTLDARIILFQCPASFTPTQEHQDNLRRFFEDTEPRDFLFAWEPRGDWPRELVGELCHDLDLIPAGDPLATPPLPGRLAYFRLHGRGGYRYTYTDDDFTELAELLPGYKEAYVLFNNSSMWDDARRFAGFIDKEEGKM